MKIHQRQEIMFDSWLALHKMYDSNDDIEEAGFKLPLEECSACDGMGTVGNNEQECSECSGSGEVDNDEVMYNHKGKLSSYGDMWAFFVREQKITLLKITDYAQFRRIRQEHLMDIENMMYIEELDKPQLLLFE